jgi:hypothetical protein
LATLPLALALALNRLIYKVKGKTSKLNFSLTQEGGEG